MNTYSPARPLLRLTLGTLLLGAILFGGLFALAPMANAQTIAGIEMPTLPDAGEITDTVTELASDLVEEVIEEVQEESNNDGDDLTTTVDPHEIVCDTFTELQELDVTDAGPTDCQATGGDGDGDGNGDSGGDGDGDGDSGGDGDGDGDSGGDGDGDGDSGGDGDGDGDGDSGGDGDGDGDSGGSSGTSGSGSSFVGDTSKTDEEEAGEGDTLVLEISNEMIVRLTETLFRLTWETNIESFGWAVFGVDSIETLNTENGPLFDYVYVTEESEEQQIEHTALILLPEAPTSDWHVRPIGERDGVLAFGKELMIGADTLAAVDACTEYISTFIRPEGPNDEEDVRRLQQFLHDIEGHQGVEITGVYDQTSQTALEDFQSKYAADVLTPWGIDAPTGFVYLTTRKKVNEIHCENTLTFPLSEEEQAEINRYRADREGGFTPTGGSSVGQTTGTTLVVEHSTGEIAQDGQDGDSAPDGEDDSQVAGAGGAVTFSLFERIGEDIRSLLGVVTGMFGGNDSSEEEVGEETEGGTTE